jgi:hypothetical protein
MSLAANKSQTLGNSTCATRLPSRADHSHMHCELPSATACTDVRRPKRSNVVLSQSPSAPNVSRSFCRFRQQPGGGATVRRGGLNGSNWNRAYIGTYNGNLTVSRGQVPTFTNGGATGNLTQNGDTMALENSSFVKATCRSAAASRLATAP